MLCLKADCSGPSRGLKESASKLLFSFIVIHMIRRLDRSPYDASWEYLSHTSEWASGLLIEGLMDNGPSKLERLLNVMLSKKVD